MLILVHLIQQNLPIFSTAAGGRENNKKETNFNHQMLMEYHLNEIFLENYKVWVGLRQLVLVSPFLSCDPFNI